MTKRSESGTAHDRGDRATRPRDPAHLARVGLAVIGRAGRRTWRWGGKRLRRARKHVRRGVSRWCKHVRRGVSRWGKHWPDRRVAILDHFPRVARRLGVELPFPGHSPLPDLFTSRPENAAELLDWRRSALRMAAEEVIRRGNFDVVNELVTDDYVMHDVPTGRAMLRETGYKEYVVELRWMFPDLVIRLDEQCVVEGDTLRSRWTALGTHAGGRPGLPASGRTVHMRGILVSRWEGKRIAEEWNWYEHDAMLAQMSARGTLEKSD